MRQIKHLQRIFLLILLTCMAFTTTVPALAAGVDENASISALYLVNNKPVSDVKISVHRIATLNDTGGIAWLDTYAKYHMTADIQDSDGAAALAQTMANYILRDSIKADFQTRTDADGHVYFERLPEGLYLITGESYTSGRYGYNIVPALVPLPYLGENGESRFHAEIELKHESIYTPPPSPGHDTTIRKVLKVWNFNVRDPEPISVNLMCNGRVYDTQTLSKENNWTYTWRELDNNCFWTLVEESVPDGFSTLVIKQGATFVVTNTEDDPSESTPPPPIDPGKPVIPPPTGPGEPTSTEPGKPNTPETPNTPYDPKLPQTGMPMQTVFTLLIISIVMAVFALVCMRKKLHQVSCIMIVVSLISMLGAGYLIWDNIQGDISAEKDSALVVETLACEIPDVQADKLAYNENLIPNFELDADRDMPEVEIAGGKYIGIVEIPSLGLTLPVQSEWSKAGAAKAPCRYIGSVYDGDCIIAAHNFKSHFGNIKLLSAGDEVKFTDAEGNIFPYTVSETETLEGYDVEGMLAGDWDLTLFTCTPGGQKRVTVRCQKA